MAHQDKRRKVEIRMSDIDPSIRPLVTMMNRHPHIRTILSCSGHLQLHSHQCMKQSATHDDLFMDRMEEVALSDLYCVNAPPYIAFQISPTKETYQLLQLLRLSPFFLIPLEVPNAFSFQFGPCGESLDERQFRGEKSFRDFWTTFHDAWNACFPAFTISAKLIHFAPNELPGPCQRYTDYLAAVDRLSNVEHLDLALW